MALDENKYKKIFEQRYGSGSYESGLKQAREIGRTKVQAEFAKKAFNDYVKEQEKKSKKKTYQDAVDYWNDPTNSEALSSKGVYRTEQELRNDPNKRQEIKDAGYNINDFIDGMYNAGTAGDSRSKREYDQKRKNNNQNVPEEPTSIIPIPKKATASKKKQSLLPPVKKKSKKKDDSILTDVKNFFTSKDTNGDGERDGLLGLADRYILPISQAATEVLLPGNEEKQIENDKAQNKGKVKNPALKAGMVDRGTETKVLHGIGTTLGYLAPYDKAAKGVELGATLFPKIASKVTNPYVQKAIKGAVTGGIAEGGLAAQNELVNPDANNMSDYLKRTAWGVGGGAIAEPLIHGAGSVLKSASERTMKGLLPNQEQVQKGFMQSIKGPQSLPKPGGIQNPGVFNEIMPRANEIANPNYLPSLTPTPKPQVTVPKVGTPIEEALANPRVEPPVTQPKAPQQAPITQPIPKQETPVQSQSAAPKNPGERSFYNTVQNPDKLSPELQQRLETFDKTYKPMSNQELVDHANDYINNDIEKAYQFVKSANKFDPRHITVGHRLIDELQKTGQYDKALDVVERLAEQGTKAGQSVQSFSIYNRLTPEGQLLRAQRHVNKINQNIADPSKHVKLNEQTIQDITHTADGIQKFAGQMEQANNVMKIMENVKKGKAATDDELETVRSFVSDAKKFFGDLDPNVPAPKVKAVKDVRTRDKVVDFMSKKEDVARQELRKIFGRANSLPVDAFYHLSVIGASKIAKGTVKLTDFTEEMAKEFGEVVRPYAKQIYNKAVETFNLQSESMTRNRLSEVEKITNKALKDKNLDVDQADTIREFARQVGAMSGDAKLESSMELQSILQALERPTFGQKISTAQTIAQLLNPKTIVRNAIGNELFYRTEQLNKLLATPIDIVRSKITGGERTITFKTNNQGQYWQNWMKGAKAGWKGVNPMGLTTSYDLGPQAFRSKFNPLTYLEKSLGATLRSFDYAGYMRAYNKTIGELASVRAVNEGLKGQARKEAIARYIREADENMVQIADKYGKFATFQDNTALSNALTKVKKGMNKVSTLGATDEFGLGDLVLKYPKTPGNLVMRALDYSPVGIIRSASLLNDAVFKAKNPLATKEATLAFTRAIMGTGGFSLLGYVLADKGILTSAGDSDYEVASLERSAGKQPNSVNVTALKRFLQSGLKLSAAGTKEGDTFISYDWAQPISIAIALGTGVSQSSKDNGELTASGAVKGGFDSASNTVINQSVLKGLNDFLANYPGRTMSDRIGDAAKGIAGSFVPTLSNQVRQVNDNTTRSTYSPNLLPEIKNRAINRVPGAEKQLPPAYDTLGNKKQTYQNGGNNLLNVFLNPSFVSKYKPSAEAQLVLDIINETGDKTLAPRIAQKKLDGEPLTSEQYSEMQRIMGTEVKQGLSRISKSSNEELNRKAIEKILREAGKKAREAIRKERGE